MYHMQRMEGNLIATLREHIGWIGHIQIADSPERHEPGTGEIHFARVLEALDVLDIRVISGWSITHCKFRGEFCLVAR